MPSCQILAHRGGLHRAPENTIKAFIQAYTDGAHGIECDVRLTKDGEPVILHTGFDKDDVSDVAGTSVGLSNLSWAAIKNLRMCGSQEPIPHLDDVLAFLNDYPLVCYLEPKERSLALAEKLIERLEPSGLLERICILTFFSRRQVLQQIKRLCPKIRTSVILLWPFQDWRKFARRAGTDEVTPGWKRGINLFYWLEPLVGFRKRVSQTQRAGLTVTAGLANQTGEINWLVQQGVDGIWTDDVPAVRRVLSR